jgi:hypothetical protein
MRFGIGDEFADIVSRRRRIDQHQQTVKHADRRNRGKILHDIIRQLLVDERCRRDRIAGEKQRVAVGRRLHDDFGSNRGVGAGTVFDDEILPEVCRKLMRHGAGFDIRAAAGGKADDNVNRAARILLGLRRPNADTGKKSQYAEQNSHRRFPPPSCPCLPRASTT